MSTALVPFENALPPAHLTQFQGIISGDDLTAGATGGFPSISIKGKCFTLVRGDERSLITRGDGTGAPSPGLEVVILRSNPALSKNFYAKSYEEGSDAKPDCYSSDGIAPAADAQSPQSVKCATCVHNQWGSRVTDNGGKGKACADSRRLAVAPVGQLNDVMLLRVPAASLKNLAQFGDQLKKRGVAYPSVSTMISFDWDVAYPLLTFKPVGFLTEPMMKAVSDVLRTDLPAQIVGLLASGRAAEAAAAATPAALPAPKPVAQVAAPQPVAQVAAPQPVAAPAPKPAPKKPAAKTVSFGGTTAAPAAQPVAAPVQQAPKPTQTVTVVDDELARDLGVVLASAGFDDA